MFNIWIKIFWLLNFVLDGKHLLYSFSATITTTDYISVEILLVMTTIREQAKLIMLQSGCYVQFFLANEE